MLKNITAAYTIEKIIRATSCVLNNDIKLSLDLIRQHKLLCSEKSKYITHNIISSLAYMLTKRQAIILDTIEKYQLLYGHEEETDSIITAISHIEEEHLALTLQLLHDHQILSKSYGVSCIINEVVFIPYNSRSEILSAIKEHNLLSGVDTGYFRMQIIRSITGLNTERRNKVLNQIRNQNLLAKVENGWLRAELIRKINQELN